MEEEMRDVEAGMDTSHLSCRVANRIKYEVKRRGLIPNHRYKVVVQVRVNEVSEVTISFLNPCHGNFATPLGCLAGREIGNSVRVSLHERIMIDWSFEVDSK